MPPLDVNADILELKGRCSRVLAAYSTASTLSCHTNGEPRLRCYKRPDFDMNKHHMLRTCYTCSLLLSLLPMTVEGQVFLFECQAEDKEFDKLEEVFLALSTSVLGNATSAAGETL